LNASEAILGYVSAQMTADTFLNKTERYYLYWSAAAECRAHIIFFYFLNSVVYYVLMKYWTAVNTIADKIKMHEGGGWCCVV
jgi:hypothetical protein